MQKPVDSGPYYYEWKVSHTLGTDAGSLDLPRNAVVTFYSGAVTVYSDPGYEEWVDLRLILHKDDGNEIPLINADKQTGANGSQFSVYEPVTPEDGRNNSSVYGYVKIYRTGSFSSVYFSAWVRITYILKEWSAE